MRVTLDKHDRFVRIMYDGCEDGFSTLFAVIENKRYGDSDRGREYSLFQRAIDISELSFKSLRYLFLNTEFKAKLKNVYEGYNNDENLRKAFKRFKDRLPNDLKLLLEIE